MKLVQLLEEITAHRLLEHSGWWNRLKFSNKMGLSI